MIENVIFLVFNLNFFLDEVAGYHEIDGHSYYIDFQHLYHTKYGSNIACNALNMSLIRFDTKEKWDAITIWLSENEISLGKRKLDPKN